MQDSPNPSSGRPAQWLAYVLVTCLCIGLFLSGMKLGSASTATQTASLWNIFSPQVESATVDASDVPDMTEFWRVWNTLDDKFAVSSSSKALTDQEKIEGAIAGLVRAYGDPYTVYMPPADAESFSEDISGEFSGVGMEVGQRDNLITIIAPLADTPAEKAGLLAGDVIVRINGDSTENMTVDDAVKLIRGERGTDVTLTVYREGESEFLDITVTRDVIEIPTVKTEQKGDVFIITLYSFNAVAESKMQAAIAEYQRSKAAKLVLDLRGNPGGYLQSAVAIASYFMPSGKVVVREQFSDGTPEDVYRTRGYQIQDFTPENLVVLVDGGSASASEILAGALQDHQVATVLGAQTFGKGSVQQLIDFDSGSALKVTVARWLTPNGTSISEGGLTPDIIISRTPQQRLAGDDPQLTAALDVLAGKEVSGETFEQNVAASEQ
ncbi:S41 family peptidase [Candidatus Kaiserbacteria bacterium]|nr:S41 family peptidase [Candidatus Kaiserbacteria bacterium]